MNKKFSLKMVVRFAASLDMGENFLYKNAGTIKTTINMKISQIDKDKR